ncbi:aminotransferase DegT [Prevotella herbatica]|uniref:Aminotransferase DegT n=1 Tax=Prevotella herbatica TaxID=2801997 RepID=A0ABN6EM01_9BACT|nr:LegC family aminotransferase [Prevotella herbatica]BCS85728.1 aminotransferase DegT [Prevotella herbatica]
MGYKKITNFVKDLFQEEKVPLAVPVFVGNEKKYLDDCIDTTFVSSVGAYVDRFEKDVAEYTKCSHAVVTASGTTALHMSLILARVEQDDEVLTQALTFIATCNALSYIGAHPVFIDVDKDTMGLSPFAVREWCAKNGVIKDEQLFNKKTGRRVKAVVPMHTFGHPIHLDEMVEVCKEYHLQLVEDAAESIGSLYKGKHTGTFGVVGALSFNGNKTITTGGGGMMLFQDEKLAEFGKHLTTQAKVPHRWEFKHDHIGYNYRMPNINAALGCAQLEHIEEYVASKRKTANEYEQFFKNVPDITFFTEPENCRSNYWLNVVLLKDKVAQQNFLQYTNDNGVMTRPIWELMNRLPMFENCETDGLKNTEWFADRVVNIPSSVRI